MEKLNFLLEEEKKRLEVEDEFINFIYLLIKLFGLGILSMFIIYIFSSILTGKIEMQERKNTVLKKEVTKAKELPRKEYKKISAQIENLDYLIKNKNYDVSNYIKSIEKSESKNLWIDTIFYENHVFSIIGRAVNLEERTKAGKKIIGKTAEKRIYEFEKSLRNTGLYQDIELVELKNVEEASLSGIPKQNIRSIEFKYNLILQ